MFPSGPLHQAMQPDKKSVIAYATDATHQPTGCFSIGFKENETSNRSIIVYKHVLSSI